MQQENNELPFSQIHWIGVPDEESAKLSDRRPGIGIETAYFRYSFDLSEPARLKLNISAHSRYRLWVNGRPVTSGPCKGDRWRHHYETVDVSDHLRRGLNVIAAKIVAFPPHEAIRRDTTPPQSVVSNAAGPCLLLRGRCLNLQGNEIVDISTGHAEWKVCPDRAVSWRFFPRTQWMGVLERVDGAQIPSGWRDAQEPEGDWVDAVKKWPGAEPRYGIVPVFPLRERPIPLLYETPREFVREMPLGSKDDIALTFSKSQGRGLPRPEAEEAFVPPHSRRVVELDAGELTTGYIRLSMSGGAGGELRIRYAESYSEEGQGRGKVKGQRDDSLNFELHGVEDEYRPAGGDDSGKSYETYEPFWFRTFRFVRIEVETKDQGLTLYSPEYLETGYPLEVGTALDTSADWLEPLWDVSLRTLRRCMHETYEDCPYYEQLQYSMDTRLQILFTYRVSGDTRLALRAIEDFHASMLPEGILLGRAPTEAPLVIFAFAIHWIWMVEDYYVQTGDLSVVRRYRPTIDAVLEWYHRKIGASGLVENPGYWGFVDWTEQWRGTQGAPTALSHGNGVSSIHNLVYAAGLQSAARLCSQSGRPDTAAEYDERASIILKAVEEQCWTEAEGLYREGPDLYEYSQHAQVWAVLSGLAEGDKAKAILRKALVKPGIAVCSYSMSFYLFRALEKAGLYDITEQLWDTWKDLLKLNLTTWPEDAVNQRSDCHGWGALPLYEFPACLLGVQPASPGWESLRIAPQSLSLSDLQGTVVTPKGKVTVSWENVAGKLHIRGSVPQGVPFEAAAPDGRTRNYPDGGMFELI